MRYITYHKSIIYCSTTAQLIICRLRALQHCRGTLELAFFYILGFNFIYQRFCLTRDQFNTSDKGILYININCLHIILYINMYF